MEKKLHVCLVLIVFEQAAMDELIRMLYTGYGVIGKRDYFDAPFTIFIKVKLPDQILN